MSRVFVEETIFDMCELVKERWGRTELLQYWYNAEPIGLERLKCWKALSIHLPFSMMYSVMARCISIPLNGASIPLAIWCCGKKRPTTLGRSRPERPWSAMWDIKSLCPPYTHIAELRTTENVKVRQLDTRLATTKTLLENIIDPVSSWSLIDRQKRDYLFLPTKRARDDFQDKNSVLVGEKIENVIHGLEKAFLKRILSFMVKCLQKRRQL